MINKQITGAVLALLTSMALSHAEEITTTAADQTALNVTVYNSNVALIKDTRQVNLAQGDQVLAFKDVSAAIRPETAILSGQHVTLREQNFEYDLLTPQTLLDKYVGKTVTIADKNPATGEIKEVPALVLANNHGIMLKIDDKIRGLSPGMSIIYDTLPKNLRDKPTMTMHINAEKQGEQALQLTYLSNQINWKADYVADLVNDNTLNLKGWVTLTNNSGSHYPNATLQLVAGNLNRVHDKTTNRMAKRTKVVAYAMADAAMQEESLMEYHLYTLTRPTTISNKQQKQVSLLEARNVPYKKRLIVMGQDSYGWQAWRQDAEYQTLTTQAKIEIDNKKVHKLGIPIPAGIVRTYQNDSQGNSQFVGEDRIRHTPENERIELVLGESFDVTAKRKQTNFKQQRITQKNAVQTVHKNNITASYQVIFKNAKDTDVTVNYLEDFFGEWRIEVQSLNSEKINSRLNQWTVNVPAKGETVLTYTVNIIN